VLRALIVAGLVSALCAGGAVARPDGGSPAVFVSVGSPSQIVGVDLTSGRVVARVRVPASPGDMTSYGARHLLVVSPRAGALTLVDSFEGRVLHVWRGFGRPVAVATNGSYAYVADAARSELAIVDLGTWKVRGRVAIRPEPRDVAVSDVALVTHAGASANLTVADLSWSQGRVLRFRHFPAGGKAEGISRQADSAYAYVTYAGSGVVGGLDWGRERVRWQRRVGANVVAIAVDAYHGRQLWVADRDAGAVLALSNGDGHVLRRLRGCPGARAVTVVGSAWVAAACGGANALAFWRQRSWGRKLVDVGGRPSGIAEVVLP